MNITFENRRVLVTGGAGGLGKAIVSKFVECGATVFALDVNSKLLTELKKELPQVNILNVDLTDWTATKVAVESCLPLHHLVNNASIFGFAPLLGVTEEQVNRITNINFSPLFNTIQLFSKDAIKNKIQGATIVNVSSVGSFVPNPESAHYCATKAATDCLTRNMAVALGPHGIRVNAIAPTAMITAFVDPIMNAEQRQNLIDLTIARQPIKEVLELEDAANLVAYLTSSFSKMITGQIVQIDGGLCVA